MTDYRKILRLDSLGLNNTKIAESCRCSRTTVIATLRQAALAGIHYPLSESMSDKDLILALYPPVPGKPIYQMPDYQRVYSEVKWTAIPLRMNSRSVAIEQ